MIAVSAGCPHCGKRFDEVTRAGLFKTVRMIYRFFVDLNAHKRACRQVLWYSQVLGCRIVE